MSEGGLGFLRAALQSHRARDALLPGASLPAAQRREGEPGPRRLRQALGPDDGVPSLSDPNTGTEFLESADIKAYLERTYALPE
jgi:hypothetical protein